MTIGNEQRFQRLAVLMPCSENPFWHDLQSCFERVAAEMGLAVECFKPHSPDPERQSDRLREIAAGGFGLIIVNPMNDHDLRDAILETAGAKIPVLDVGVKMRQDLIRDALPYYVPVRTADFAEQGRLGAAYIVERFVASGGGGGVVVLEGRRDAFQSRERCRGAEEVFSRSFAVHRVDSLFADFDREKAKEIALEVLRSEPLIKGFFCVNDEMALGVADAVDCAGDIPHPIIVGVDGIDEARRAVMEGRLSATVAFSPREVATIVLDSALAVLRGDQTFPVGHVRSVLVTGENIFAWRNGEICHD